ncbi:MAG: hypothetical protein V1936_00385 [Patescibacteria group bacterium]
MSPLRQTIDQSLGIQPQLISNEPLPENLALLEKDPEVSRKINSLNRELKTPNMANSWDDSAALGLAESFNPAEDSPLRDPNAGLQPFLNKFLGEFDGWSKKSRDGRNGFERQFDRGNDHIGNQAVAIAEFTKAIRNSLMYGSDLKGVDKIIGYIATQRLMQKYGVDKFWKLKGSVQGYEFQMPIEYQQELDTLKKQVCEELIPIAKFWMAAFVENVKIKNWQDRIDEQRPNRAKSQNKTGGDLAKILARVSGAQPMDIAIQLTGPMPADWTTPKSVIAEQLEQAQQALVDATRAGVEAATKHQTEVAGLQGQLKEAQAAKDNAEKENAGMKANIADAVRQLTNAVNNPVGFPKKIDPTAIQAIIAELQKL